MTTEILDFTIPADGASGPGWGDDLQAALARLDDSSMFTPSSRGGVGDGIADDTFPVLSVIVAAAANYLVGRQSWINLEGRTWAVADLPWPSGVVFFNGQLKLRPGANCPLISTTAFDALTGTNSSGGAEHVGAYSVWFNGNKADQTVAADLVRIYGRRPRLVDCNIYHSKGRNLVTEWSSDLGSPGPDGMEGSFRNYQIFGADGDGWHDNGPHDSRATGGEIFENAGINLDVGPKGNGTQFTDLHSWGLPHTIGVRLGATGVQLKGFQGEGASDTEVLVLANDCKINGVLYQPGGTPLIGTAIGIGIGDATHDVSGVKVVADILNFASAYDATGDVGGNWVEGQVFQTVGPEVIGTFSPDTVQMIAMAGRVGQTSLFNFKGRVVLPEGADVRGNLSIETAAGFQLKIVTTDEDSNRTEIHFVKGGASLFIIGADRNGDGGQDFFIFDGVDAAHRLLINADGSVGIPGHLGLSAGMAFPGSAGVQTGWLDIYDPTGATVVAKVPLHNPT